MGFGFVRVINEDRVAPGKGFDSHQHSDMEIVTFVIEGQLEHKDSLGNGSVIEAGDIQRMSAGSGIFHSEFNASTQNEVHFYQIWIKPELKGVEPSYAQKSLQEFSDNSPISLIISKSGRDNSLTINQEIDVYFIKLNAEEKLSFEFSEEKRTGWLQVIAGELAVNDSELSSSDGMAISEEKTLSFRALKQSSALLFEMR